MLALMIKGRPFPSNGLYRVSALLCEPFQTKSHVMTALTIGVKKECKAPSIFEIAAPGRYFLAKAVSILFLMRDSMYVVGTHEELEITGGGVLYLPSLAASKKCDLRIAFLVVSVSSCFLTGLGWPNA